MQNPKIVQFVELLQAQAAGEQSAIERILGLSISLKDGYCLYNIFQQWKGAFSFPEGRNEALNLVLAIARQLNQFSPDDTLQMYKTLEWKQLIELRGPVETVIFKECSKCSHRYVQMATSGFYDANGLVCRGCGTSILSLTMTNP